MPKIENISKNLNKYVEEFGSVFSLSESSIENESLFCNYCKKNIMCSKKK